MFYKYILYNKIFYIAIYSFYIFGGIILKKSTSLDTTSKIRFIFPHVEGYDIEVGFL